MHASRRPIVVVGSVTMDLVTRTPQIPRVGQTLIGTGFHTTPGGKGANQSVAAARLGYPVAMVAKVGDDHYGPTLLKSLADAGVADGRNGAGRRVFRHCGDLSCGQQRELDRGCSRREWQNGSRHC